MRAPSETDLLALWERGHGRHPIDRALLLCAWSTPELAPNQLAGLPLGTLGAALLRLRAACFGPRIDAYVDCAGCGERLALALDVAELLAAADPGEAEAALEMAEIDIDGVHVRVPTSRDLAAVAGESDPDAAALRLLERCCVTPADSPPTLLVDLRERIEAALETLDPAADLSLALACQRCGDRSVAGLDIAALLWDELDTRARALIGEVHGLARAYGWTEPEVLALSPQRRAVYLDLVGT
jgi:hypothetical protein